ncbi:hypothetical protein [Cloacibacterium sp.]|uniref:hypothetical protein n=1 Tax=Cloacibacterium sp. TaxID=1913682 RepID=UPI0039E4401B
MKNTLPILFIIISHFINAQVEKKNVSSGEITIITNDKIKFQNLSWKNDKAYYYNLESNKNEELYDASIISIQEKKLQDLGIKTLEPIVDNLYRPNYPEGIYSTKEEFINKKPSSNKKITKRGLIGWEKPIINNDERVCFFFDEKESKIKNVFAIVYDGILYFNIQNILKHRNKTDRAQDSDNPNSFARVFIGGEKYLYTEINIGNVWEKAFAYGAIGGAAGGSLAQMANHYKGVVWDYKNLEFNIFKNCLDYNDFIKDKSPSDIQKCDKTQLDNYKVQNVMEKIK